MAGLPQIRAMQEAEDVRNSAHRELQEMHAEAQHELDRTRAEAENAIAQVGVLASSQDQNCEGQISVLDHRDSVPPHCFMHKPTVLRHAQRTYIKWEAY